HLVGARRRQDAVPRAGRRPRQRGSCEAGSHEASRTGIPQRVSRRGGQRAVTLDAVGMVRPTYDEFVSLAQRGNVVPISCEILGDLETPVSAFLKIHRGRHGFLLESVQGGEKWGRYSFL